MMKGGSVPPSTLRLLRAVMICRVVWCHAGEGARDVLQALALWAMYTSDCEPETHARQGGCLRSEAPAHAQLCAGQTMKTLDHSCPEMPFARLPACMRRVHNHLAFTASQSAQSLTQLPARSLHPAPRHAAHAATAHRVGGHSHLGAGRQDLRDVGILLGLPHALIVMVAPVCGPLVTLPAGAGMSPHCAARSPRQARHVPATTPAVAVLLQASARRRPERLVTLSTWTQAHCQKPLQAAHCCPDALHEAPGHLARATVEASCWQLAAASTAELLGRQPCLAAEKVRPGGHASQQVKFGQAVTPRSTTSSARQSRLTSPRWPSAGTPAYPVGCLHPAGCSLWASHASREPFASLVLRTLCAAQVLKKPCSARAGKRCAAQGGAADDRHRPAVG